MGEFELYKNIISLGSGIEALLEKKLIGPALILIYSAIDTVGWLDSPGEATRKSFTLWVDNYLLRARPLAATSEDLYGARCGYLHTFSPDSRLTTEGKARRICYAWGMAKVDELHRSIDLRGQSAKYVAVGVNDLYEGWRLGVEMFIQEIDSDPDRKEKVYEKAKRFFADLSMQELSAALDVLQKDQ